MGPEEYKGFRKSRLQLFSRIRLKNIFPGEWDSIYTGEGIEYADIKPFEPGDDLKDLDLIALVQSGEEEIIQRAVGRQMRVFVWADLSGSMLRFEENFLSSKPDIRDIAIGLVVYSANNVYSPVGLCAFDGGIRSFLPARYGETQCQKILDSIIDADYKGCHAPADIPGAVAFMMHKAYRQSMVFFVSDFKDPVFEEDFTELLRPVVTKFDFIPIIVRDPIEKDVALKMPVNISVVDSESGGTREIYLTPKKLTEMQKISAELVSHLESNFRKLGIRPVVLDSPQVNDCVRTLTGFFEGRKRTRV